MNGAAAAAPIALGLGAATLLGVGFVLQQRMARLLPAGDTLSPRLFADLIRKPLWLAGIAAMVGGQLLGALALGVGDVSLIEPLLTTNLFFALLIARWLSGQAFGLREWGGALGLVCGVVVFLVSAHPEPAGDDHTDGTATGTGLANLVCLAAVAVLVCGSVGAARRRAGTPRAVLLAAAAGVLFGLQDGLTRGVMNSLGHGLSALFASWATYVLVATAVVGILLMQSAFQAAPLRVALPIVTAVEPLTGIGYGIGVYGEQVGTSPAATAGEVSGLIIMLLGVVLVTRSHALHAHHPHRP